MFLAGSRLLKSGCFIGKLTVEQVLKSFSGRNNSLKPPVFGFCNSLPYDPEIARLESLDLFGFVFIGIQKYKKILPSFFCFWATIIYRFTNYFGILIFLFSNIAGVPTC